MNCLASIDEIPPSTSGQGAPAETGRREATSSAVQSIIDLLSENRTSSRDDRLYAAAGELFRAIDTGQEPVESRATLATALREVSLGGHANAWIDYGRCLRNGWGIPENREEALAAYKRAADHGSDHGLYLVAHDLYWTFRRYDEAYSYARAALKGDDRDGAVRHLLGLMAYHGRGRPKDLCQSVWLHLEAADRGNANAFFELFTYAMLGIVDRRKATFYLKEAARRDQPCACANLGSLYAAGQPPEIRKDATEAVRWYTRAGQLGFDVDEYLRANPRIAIARDVAST